VFEGRPYVPRAVVVYEDPVSKWFPIYEYLSRSMEPTELATLVEFNSSRGPNDEKVTSLGPLNAVIPRGILPYLREILSACF
jgi:hypothetical protein